MENYEFLQSKDFFEKPRPYTFQTGSRLSLEIKNKRCVRFGEIHCSICIVLSDTPNSKITYCYIFRLRLYLTFYLKTFSSLMLEINWIWYCWMIKMLILLHVNCNAIDMNNYSIHFVFVSFPKLIITQYILFLFHFQN